MQGISYTDGADGKDRRYPVYDRAAAVSGETRPGSGGRSLGAGHPGQCPDKFRPRNESLQRNSVASVQNLDDARAQRDTAQANVAQAQANTQIAAINYSYTRVLAPFDGRVSAHLVSVGDLVGTSADQTRHRSCRSSRFM